MAADLFEQPVNKTDAMGFFFEYPNTITDGLFAIGLLFVIYVIVFGSLLRFGINRAFAASAFIGFLTTTVFTSAGIVGGQVWTMSVVVLIAAIITGGGNRK